MMTMIIITIISKLSSMVGSHKISWPILNAKKLRYSKPKHLLT